MKAESRPETVFLSEYFGYELHERFGRRDGWLLNYQIKEKLHPDTKIPTAHGVLYFVDAERKNFRVEVPFYPRITVQAEESASTGVEEHLLAKYSTYIKQILPITKNNLQDISHLNTHAGESKDKYLSILCYTEQSASALKREIDETIRRNRQTLRDQAAVLLFSKEKRHCRDKAPEASILDVFEHDIPVAVQMGIVLNINAGRWYTVEYSGEYDIRESELIVPPSLRILSFDIETTKDPLKFPSAEKDKVMMISAMAENDGWLIVNREVVSADIAPFEFRPTADIGGEFEVFNEGTEKHLLQKFVELVHTFKPHVISTYNGEFFDWPFVEQRMHVHGISLANTVGFYKNGREEYLCEFILHLDCFKWVKRDSYLPAGSHGLKSVTKAKLGYHPDELDPEDMMVFASTKPKVLASYSVSDAVATHFLYLKYVHPFIFSLASLIPLPPDDVLRKGSGTLCESLLMKEAYRCEVLIPSKKRTRLLYKHNGRVADSLSYIGGHVECLKSGVYRSDFEYSFVFQKEYLKGMIEGIDEILEMEAGGKEIANRAEVKADIAARLGCLLSIGEGKLRPSIYHLDVGAMYPNIILTNRLQPVAITDERRCAQCVHYKEKEKCQRKMEWKSRAEVFPIDEKTVALISKRVSGEKSTEKDVPGGGPTYEERLRDALAEHSKKTNKKTREVVIEEKQSIICQKENPFYVDAVRKFRDRRNEYKAMTKKAKAQSAEARAQKRREDAEEFSKKASVYDSLQIAHKCVLNSFYGYVMKKGARWHSMEMAAVVCQTGSSIIQKTKAVIDMFGVTLELDTDGIWALLPEGFPAHYTLHTSTGPVGFSYICSLLNHMLVTEFTNPQYQRETAPGVYSTHAENSIRFEIDGPYRAMFLPGSAKEGESIKKRYIVINSKERISELKGFEFKRRGELKFVKAFQEEMFNTLLTGHTLEECYLALAQCAEYWLDIIESQGEPLSTEEVFEYFGETRSMTKDASEYEAVKSTCLTAAKRLAEVLGQSGASKGTACSFIISRFPEGEPVTSRAIPQSVFYAAPEIRDRYLRKWTGARVLPDLHGLVDWEYYQERLTNVILKIIIVPSAFQGLKNPIPRVSPPQWTVQHRKLTDWATPARSTPAEDVRARSAAGHKEPGEEDIKDASSQVLPRKEKEKENKSAAQAQHRVTQYFTSKEGKGKEKEKGEGEVPEHAEGENKENGREGCREVRKCSVREDKRDLLPQVVSFRQINEHAVETVHFNGTEFVREEKEIRKVFYLQADEEVLEKLAGVYRETEKTPKIQMKKLRRSTVGEAEEKEFLQVSVDPKEFSSNFCKYRDLFESFEIQRIVELDVPFMARAAEMFGYQKLPALCAAACSFGTKHVYAFFDMETKDVQTFSSAEKVQEYLQKKAPSIVFTTKTFPDAIDLQRFYVCRQQTQASKTIEGAAAAEALLQVSLAGVRAEACKAYALSEYACMPLHISEEEPGQGQSLNYLLDFLHYTERQQRNIIGWNNEASSTDTHYTLSTPAHNPFKNEFYQEGLYQGLSKVLYMSGTALLGVIESDTLMKEEGTDTQQTQDMQVIRQFMKKLVYHYIKKEPGVQYLLKEACAWCKTHARGGTITEAVSVEVSLLQIKFVSGLLRRIKLLGLDIITTDCEEVLVHTRQSTQELAESQVSHAVKELQSLEYGSLLTVQGGPWLRRVLYIDPAHYYFEYASGRVHKQFEVPAPSGVLEDLIQSKELSSLECLRDAYRESPKDSVQLARLFIKIRSLCTPSSGYARKAAGVIQVSPFAEELSKEYGHLASISLHCPCGVSTSKHTSIWEDVSQEETNESFEMLVRYPKRIAVHCKRCNGVFSRAQVEDAVCTQMYTCAKAAIKKEKKCRSCKKPSAGIIAVRCLCGGVLDKEAPQTFSTAKKAILSLASLAPTIPVLTYAQSLLRYFEAAPLSAPS
ncbi:DNA polymerase epsilon subunit 1 [Nematocida sp. AWRm77]|nr:DNA polymerase epsilon subunit 1 [Nematocida sp. AWRm77]